MRRIGFTTIAAVVTLVAVAHDARAQTPAASAPATPAAAPPAATPAATAPEAISDDRLLKGHRFLFPILQEQIPFATTHFGVRQGLALATFPKVPLGPLGRIDLSASGLAQNFDAGIRITDWLSIGATGAGQVITGININSIVLQGANFTAGAEAGPQLRLFRSESSGTRVSVSLTGGGATGRAVSVLPLVSALIATSGQSLDTVLNGNIGKLVLVPTSSATFAGTVSAAQTLTPNFALVGSLQGRYTNDVQSPFDATKNASVDVSSSNVQIKGALAVTADGSPSGIPVALMLEYLADNSNTTSGSTAGPSESASELAHFVAAGVYYSGRPSLQVGVGGAYQLGLKPLAGIDAAGAPAKSDAPSLLFGQFILRYIW